MLIKITPGRLPSQHGVHDWISGGNGCTDEGIYYTRNEQAYTDVLAEHGYECAISGKYHLGDQQETQHSFSHWFVHQKGGASYIDPPMVNNSQCVNIKGYVTDIITDDAISYLNLVGKDTKPFYLSVHYTSPHAPYIGSDGRADSMHPKEYVDLYNDAEFVSCPQEPENPYARHFRTTWCLGNRECLKGYYAAVTAMDANIGRIMDALKENQLDEHTLVVFASDHGFNAGHHGFWGKGNAAYPLNMFETSIRIPMIWRHTGTIKPGVEESVVQVLDVAPTLLEYAGNFTLSVMANSPGESFVDLLLDETVRNTRTTRTIYGEYGQTRYVRVSAITGGSRKYISRLTGHVEMYDLFNDKNETKNLILEGLYSVEAALNEAKLRKWFSFYEDPYTSGWTQPVTGKGQERAIYYNRTGWPNTPPFSKL